MCRVKNKYIHIWEQHFPSKNKQYSFIKVVWYSCKNIYSKSIAVYYGKDFQVFKYLCSFDIADLD